MDTWSDKIKSIEQRGWTLSAMAVELETRLSTLSEIKSERTKQPRGSLAVRLNTLHAQVCGNHQEAA